MSFMGIEFLGKEISGRYTIPSGVVMTGALVLERLAQEIPQLGILTTKSISLEEKKGNLEPILAQVGRGSFINAVGLANKGAKVFSQELKNIVIPNDKFLLASIIGSNEEDFFEVAKILEKQVDGFELNVSCPHAEGQGQVVGQDFDLVTKIIKKIKTLGKPVVVKISPKLSIEQSVKAIMAGGADGITAINTLGPEEYLVDGQVVLFNKVGGISGKRILDRGIRVVKEIKARVFLPIIGCGGISSAEDVVKYADAGAEFFGVGSALAGMSTHEIINYFKTLDGDVRNGTNQTKNLIKQELNMNYKKIKVKEKNRISDDFFILRFEQRIEAKAGQFVMLGRLGENGEKPYSVYGTDPFEILFQVRGCRTKELANLKRGEEINVRGPYGNSPCIRGKSLLVGGGTGIAALRLFAKENKESIVVVGAKDKQHLPNMSDWENKNIIIYTQDGSLGRKGLVTDDLEKIIEENNLEYVINCGPLPMIESAITKEKKRISLSHIFSSEELVTMCGVGICGRCATKDGQRNCVDGTFFNHAVF